jgi:CRISPR system Cascade subunit CasE
MFLSRLSLNLRSSRARLDLAQPYEMHKTVWNCHPTVRRDPATGAFLDRLLFRVDADHGSPTLLVQSEVEPDWGHLPDGYLRTSPPDCKPLDVAFTPGQRLRFRLRANPTKRVAAKNPGFAGTMVGKRVGLNTEVEQIRWLLRKGEAGGFTVPGEWVAAKHPATAGPIELPNFRVDAISEGRVHHVKGGTGALAAVRFEGVLVVTDPAAFRDTVFAGIGSAKGLGFGLLSVAPAGA